MRVLRETLQPVGLLITYFDEPRWLRRSDDYEECSCPGAAERREKLRKEKEAALKAEQKRAYREKVERMIEASRLGSASERAPLRLTCRQAE